MKYKYATILIFLLMTFLLLSCVTSTQVLKVHDGLDLPEDKLCVLRITKHGFFSLKDGKLYLSHIDGEKLSSLCEECGKREGKACCIHDRGAFDVDVIYLSPGTHTIATELKFPTGGSESAYSLNFTCKPGHEYELDYQFFPIKTIWLPLGGTETTGKWSASVREKRDLWRK